MADAVEPNGNGDVTDQTERMVTPPTDPSQVPIWAMSMAMGETMAEGFLQDPEWTAAMNDAGMTEEDFANFWSGLMNEVLKEMGKFEDKIKEMNEDDEEKNAATAAVAIGS